MVTGGFVFSFAEQACKPSSVYAAIYLRPIVAKRLLRSYLKQSGPPYTLPFDLASDGVYRALAVAGQAVSPYLTFPPLPAHGQAVYFCCTFLRVASTGRYPASLPCEARTFLMAVMPPRGCPSYSAHLAYHKTGASATSDYGNFRTNASCHNAGRNQRIITNSRRPPALTQYHSPNPVVFPPIFHSLVPQIVND